jgi:hypothetical protein
VHCGERRESLDWLHKASEEKCAGAGENEEGAMAEEMKQGGRRTEEDEEEDEEGQKEE